VGEARGIVAATRPYAGITRIRFGGSVSPRGSFEPEDPSREMSTVIELWDNFKLGNASLRHNLKQ